MASGALAGNEWPESVLVEYRLQFAGFNVGKARRLDVSTLLGDAVISAQRVVIRTSCR